MGLLVLLLVVVGCGICDWLLGGVDCLEVRFDEFLFVVLVAGGLVGAEGEGGVLPYVSGLTTSQALLSLFAQLGTAAEVILDYSVCDNSKTQCFGYSTLSS